MRVSAARMLAVGVFVALSCAGEARAQATGADPYDMLVEGKSTFERVCSACHGLDRPNAKTAGAAEWGAIVDRMESYGAPIGAAARKKILGWLAAKSTFDTKCSLCHGRDRSLEMRKSRADWTATVRRMAGMKPGHLSDAEVATIAAYLSLVRPAP